MVKGVVINDLHFGIKDSKRLYDELSLFKNYLKERDDLELLIIDGDYFDCKLSIGDSAAFYAMSFFAELMQIVKEKKLVVRMVLGTRSHELNQLQIFKPYENNINYNFRLIETVEKEDLLGMHVLYIPEEYPEDSVEYYKEFKEDTYDAIFGHGTWLFQAAPGVYEKSLQDTHTAPVFVEEEWVKCIPNGFCSFGHIHSRHIWPETKEINDKTKIFYSGAYTRWNFGERSARGFTYFESDPENKTYHVEFVDNTIAPKYDVLDIRDLGIDLNVATAQDLQIILDEQVSKTDNLRIDIVNLSKDKTDILKKYYANKPNVKIEIKDNKVLLKESHTNEEKAEFAKYHYITKRELPLNETIKKYCKEEMNVDLSLDTIDKILENK